MKIKLCAAAIAFAAIACAGTVISPTNVTGVDVFSGPTFSLTTDAQLTDVLTLAARGEVYLQSGSTYGTNAAGVITTAGSASVGQSSPCACGLGTYAALLIGNGSYGFFQVFPTDAGNGLGSATPPSCTACCVMQARRSNAPHARSARTTRPGAW